MCSNVFAQDLEKQNLLAKLTRERVIFLFHTMYLKFGRTKVLRHIYVIDKITMHILNYLICQGLQQIRRHQPTATLCSSPKHCYFVVNGGVRILQVDMYGLLGTIHCLLFMDYMKVYKHKEGRWKISKSFKRYAHFRLPVHRRCPRRCLSRSKRCLKTFLGVGPNTVFRIAVNVVWESTHSPPG